ncbi:hypothetical protein BJF81_09565 [Ornithinimicrobium sp. CNJ-824]|uniref:hypothetical protein n=1 Tax=Ornithinimicrobium sp. CNJ-824 TaxID=1904966 RepID=UPI00095D8200|nr:hypothetical protein [Ornithinimicrobium sp. CNJ-824]OLT23819.1 hypothetical protein BJF81_09565 [Ornithinimicrobium sp. CNJ-824]
MNRTSNQGNGRAGRDRAAQHPADRDPADLAPSVERAWADEFALEQRLLDVPGARIGDALVTVESHVAESGETAREPSATPGPTPGSWPRARGPHPVRSGRPRRPGPCSGWSG